MKNAKKSMFITTILMVAVLVVAVSTATFAWYTASSGGSAGTSTLTSANSEEANITIGWGAGDMTTSIEDLAPAAKTVAPCVPLSAFTNANVYGAPGSENVMAFYKASINADANSTFAADGASADADLWKISHDSSDLFYVTNRNTTTAATITMTIDVADDAELRNQLFVAVFVNGTYAGVLNDNSKAYTYGEINIDDTSIPGADAPMKTAASTTSISFDLAASTGATIQLVAWLDGTTTADANSNKTVAFAFDFSAALKNA